MTEDVKALIARALASNDPDALHLAHQLVQSPALYKNDPCGYIRNVLGVNLWSKQKEIASALVKHRRVMVRSANAIGKTFLVACLALWFYQTRNPSITIITAPTARQIEDLTFKEIRRFYQGEGLYPKKPKIFDTSEHYVYGFTATDATSFQGTHDADIFVIFEENQGVDGAFWEAAEGMLSGGDAYWLSVCNPTDTSSTAYQEEQSGKWHVIEVSAFDHPNIALELDGQPPLIPGAVRLEQITDLVDKWCQPVTGEPTSCDFEFRGRWYRPGPIAAARILGRYPSAGSYTVFADPDFTRARTSALDYAEADEIEIGCDVARFGDDLTSIHVVRGPVSVHHESYNGRPTDYTAERLKALARTYAVGDPKKVPIRVDSAGVGGGLCDQRADYNFVEINSAHAASDPDAYPNKRSELLFTVAELLRTNAVSFARLDPDTVNEIRRQAMGITYKLDAKGRRVAEPKDQTKKRIGRSPDDLDAITLAYCGRSPLADLGAFITQLSQTNMAPKDYKTEVEDQFKLYIGDTMIADVNADYKHVHLIRSYGTYQARPFINKTEVPLGDFASQHEAAYSVNVARKLTGGGKDVNKLKEKLTPEREKFVEEDTARRLTQRNLIRD